MITIKKIKNIITISENESKICKTLNKELNININNFITSKIFPDIISILKNSNTFDFSKNKNNYMIYQTENLFTISAYKTLEDFLYEPFSLEKVEFCKYIKDVENYLIKKYENYFYLIIKNLLKKEPEKEYINYLTHLLFNKIQRLNLQNVFIDNPEEYNLIKKRSIKNTDISNIRQKFLKIVNNYTNKNNVELNIKSNFNNITLKLKKQDNEVNNFILEEILNKFLNTNFNFFIKQSSYFSIDNKSIDIIEGYSLSEEEIIKIKKENIKDFMINKNFIKKTLFN